MSSYFYCKGDGTQLFVKIIKPITDENIEEIVQGKGKWYRIKGTNSFFVEFDNKVVASQFYDHWKINPEIRVRFAFRKNKNE